MDTIIEPQLSSNPVEFKYEAFSSSESNGSRIPELATPVLGTFSGTFAMLDAESRNRRFYSSEFWETVINSPEVRNALKNGTMVGTFEHPMVRDFYNNSGQGTASHPLNGAFVTKSLWIEGKRLMGKGYLLNTPLGKILSTYFLARDEEGVPLVQLYISARGESRNMYHSRGGVDMMDPRDYYLRSFDIVMNPGFLEAKVSMTSVNESYSDNLGISELYRNRLSIINRLGLKSIKY